MINVTDYGAIGDDLTDDTAAFALAAADDVPLVVPAGIYRVSGCTFTRQVTFRPGAQIRQTGGTLAFDGGIEAPIACIFLDASDVTAKWTPEAWADWFGNDADAVEMCHRVFSCTRMAPWDYGDTRPLVLNESYRTVRGMGGSAEGWGGTRFILSGPAAATDPVIIYGTGETNDVLACSRRLNVSGINTVRDGIANPAAKRVDAVPGWEIKGLYESEAERLFDYNSPTGYRINAVVGCNMKRLGRVRPTAGADNGNPDYSTGMVVGGDEANFGFIGANASLRISDCYDAGAVGHEPMGMLLYGYIADTWVHRLETGQMPFGMVVDGAKSDGTAVTDLAAHTDVEIDGCVLDNCSGNCLTIKNTNIGGSIQLRANYGTMGAVNAMGVRFDNSNALVTMTGGGLTGNSDVFTFGIVATNSQRIYQDGMAINDAGRGLHLDNVSRSSFRPVIARNSGPVMNDAVFLNGVTRCTIAPIVDGAAKFTYGIVTNSSVTYSEINLTGVNHGAFTTPVAARKIWHNGASWGGGATFPGGNVVSGVRN